MTIKQLYPTQRPALDLNFARQKRLDPRVTFTRGSTATYVGSDGLIKTAASGEARFDHDSDTGESLGLLIEESRTNLFTHSQDFSTWIMNNQSVTANATTAPDSTITAYKLVESNASEFHRISISINLTGSHTMTVFAKAAERDILTLIPASTSGGGQPVYFDLTNGTISASLGSATSASIQALPNGWYRCSVTDSMSGFGYPFLGVAQTSGTESYQGDGTSGIYIWGAQLEAGSFPTSYIPTSGSTVTRAADVVSLTNSSIYDTDSFTILNEPFGSAGGSSTLSLVGAGATPIKRTAVYSQDLSQTQINTLVKKDDEFWRWRILGSSFGLPNFVTDGQVTVDWGDGTVETLTTSDHTFTDGGGYHEIGFRLDSGTYFRPYINNNASHVTKVVAVGPAPESMKFDGQRAFFACTNLEAFDAAVDLSGGTDLYRAWRACTNLKSFPALDTSSITFFDSAWANCSSLTSFPLLNTATGTGFTEAWLNCTSLTSFPLIDTSNGTNFSSSWYNCNSLTSFPAIDTSSGTNFSNAWYNCISLTSFPLIDTSSGQDFSSAWRFCTSLTTFPEIDTSSGTYFFQTWLGCSSLASFPSINTSGSTSFKSAWDGCSSLTTFPANFFDSWTGTPANDCFTNAWNNCSSLTATSVENILNSIDTSGQSAPASGVDITIDYNASSGTPSVATAVTNLKSRGWTITLNGVAQ
jgi:hypothetical protein